jgi:hypothetical protein
MVIKPNLDSMMGLSNRHTYPNLQGMLYMSNDSSKTCKTLAIPYWTCSPGAGTSLYGKPIHWTSHLVVRVSLSRSCKPLIHSLMDRRHKVFPMHRPGLSPWGNTPLCVPSFSVFTSCFQLTICCNWKIGHTYIIFLFCIFFTILIVMPWKWPLCILVSQDTD